jgi:ribosomal protein S18 acetylase RimI-like enzyme
MQHQIPFWQNYIQNHGDNVVLKDSRDEIKGYANLEVIDNVGNVNFIAIDPSLQGSGMGSKLLQYSEKNFNGVSELLLHTEGSKLQNLEFYDKNGWKIHAIDPTGYSHTTSVEFRKKI